LAQAIRHFVTKNGQNTRDCRGGLTFCERMFISIFISFYNNRVPAIERNPAAGEKMAIPILRILRADV
jgi:hypothetical protein